MLWSCGGTAPTPSPPAGEAITIPDWAGPGAVPRVQAVVDLRARDDGWMRIRMRFDDLTPAMNAFKEVGKSPELRFRNVRFYDSEGDALTASVDGRTWSVGLFRGGSISAEFEVQPGGDGRHGRQGLVATDWATFDGRVFLLPLGAGDLRAGRMRVEAPDGWVAVGPLPESEGWMDLGVYGPTGVQAALVGSCYGVGDFEGTVSRVGAMEVREYHPRSWSPQDRARLSQGTMDVFGWFHDKLSFAPSFPVAVVWTPNSDGKRVYGGSSANGTCMDNPNSTTRAYELLAHRLAHAMNKYHPSGMHLRDDRDEWFKEGWASFVEAQATEAVGLGGSTSRWSTVQRTYREVREEHPERDIALSDEPTAKGDTTEHLHYAKGPLVVRLLDDWLRRKNGSELTEFMRLSWENHGMRKSPLALRDELAAWSGVNLDDFWAVHVDQRGWLYPIGVEAISADVRARNSAVGGHRVGGRPITTDYLFLLVESEEFRRFADIVRFLEEEEPRRRLLAANGVALLPPALEEVRAGLDPKDRFDLVRSERAWPLHAGITVPDDGRLVLDPVDPRAQLFSQLLADEAAYEAALLPSGMDAMYIHTKNAQGEFKTRHHLTIPADAEVRLESVWLAPAGQMEVRARRGSEVSHTRTTDIWSDWTRAWSPYVTGQLPKGPGIVTFEIETTAGAKVARSYWRSGG